MKLSNNLLLLCIQIIFTSVFSSPVKYVTQNVINYNRKCGFDDEIMNTKSEKRMKRFTKYGSSWKNKTVTWK